MREVGKRKPAPDAILECAQRLQVPIKNCLVVGDTVDDILAARSAGALLWPCRRGRMRGIFSKRKNLNFSLIASKDFSFFWLHLYEIEIKRFPGGKTR
jgi:beta-phosphoglucomutase-like phosphatase (HAD superfamily)